MRHLQKLPNGSPKTDFWPETVTVRFYLMTLSREAEAKYDQLNQLSASAALLKTSHPQKQEVKKGKLISTLICMRIF